MANTKKSAPKVSDAQAKKLAEFTSMAAKIRYLASEKFSKGDISRALGIRYQWVRNVLLTPVKNG